MKGDKVVFEFPAELAEELFNEMPMRTYAKATNVFLSNANGTITMHVKCRDASEPQVPLEQLILAVRARQQP